MYEIKSKFIQRLHKAKKNFKCKTFYLTLKFRELNSNLKKKINFKPFGLIKMLKYIG